MTRPTRNAPEPPGARRGVPALATALFVALAGSAVLLPAPAQARVAASQPLVVLDHDQVARAGPDADARQIESVAARRPLTRARTVLPVLGDTVSGGGSSWVPVGLPGRPNGHRGWIPTEGTTSTSTPWHISVKLSSRTVTVYRNGRAARRFRAVVGKRSTPTPQGSFFIEEALRISRRDDGGPFALAASARSNVLQEFAGGPGQIGLHGTNNLSGALGSAVSHGCVRVSPSAITWMAQRIDGGVPLTIRR